MRISAAIKNTDSRFSKILYEAYPSSSNRWLKGSVSEKPHSYSLSGASMSNDTSSATNLKTKKLLDGMFTLFNGMWTSIWSALMQLQSIQNEISLSVARTIEPQQKALMGILIQSIRLCYSKNSSSVIYGDSSVKMTYLSGIVSESRLLLSRRYKPSSTCSISSHRKKSAVSTNEMRTLSSVLPDEEEIASGLSKLILI